MYSYILKTAVIYAYVKSTDDLKRIKQNETKPSSSSSFANTPHPANYFFVPIFWTTNQIKVSLTQSTKHIKTYCIHLQTMRKKREKKTRNLIKKLAGVQLAIAVVQIRNIFFAFFFSFFFLCQRSCCSWC